MTDIISTINKRSPRYDVKNASGLTLTIQKEDESCEPIEGQLLNLSVGGARIRVKEKIPDKELFVVRIEVEHPKRVIVVSGNVCWVTPAAGDDWSLGCKFAPPIPAEVLHDFAEAGILERREHGRKRVSQRTSAQWQLRSGTTDVRIIDYSQGGYCLCSQVEGQLGERTILQLESGEERTIRVPGEIKWQVESPDGFVIGCQFLDAQDFNVLCELLEPIPRVGSHHSKLHSLLGRSRLSRRSPRVIVACAVALLCIAIIRGLILPTSIQKSNATQSAAAPLNQNHDSLEMDRTRGGTHGVVDEKGAVEARTGLTNSGSKTTSTKSPTFAGTLDAVRHSRPISANVESSRDQIFNVDQSVDKTPRKAASRSGDVRGLGSPSTHVATSTVARNHSLDSVSGQVKGVTIDAHKKEDNPSKTIVNNYAARATDNPETIAASPVGYRTWIDVTGRYRTVARIVSVKNNMIRLQKQDGDFVLFPLDRLSQADVRFVRRWYPVSQ